MAYYSALIAAWNSSIQPPAGVTGTGLSSGMTTQTKMNTVNAWTVTAPSIEMIIPTYKIYNLVNGTEFAALSTANQQLVRDILFMGSVDASSGTQIRSRIISIFPSSTLTFASLAALASAYDTPQVPWWGSSNGGGLTSPVNSADLAIAGLS
jgi:hypothetical protein